MSPTRPQLMSALAWLCPFVVPIDAYDCNVHGMCPQSEEDTSTMLQVKEVMDVEKHVDVEEETDHCAKKSKSSCGTSNTDKCTWSGLECKTGCMHFSSEASCPAYCHWDTVDRADEDGGGPTRCRAMMGGVNIGGSTSMSRGRYVNRPELKITEHHSAANGWQPCGGKTNCIGGNAFSYLTSELTSSVYDKVALEVLIKCEHEGDIWVDLSRSNNFASSNARLQVWYNLKEQNVDVFGKSDVRSRILKVPVRSSDAYPTLRVEVSRVNFGQSVSLKGLKIRLKNAPAVFDKCMTEKFKFAQCTNLIANDELRSDHDKQLACAKGYSMSAPGCPEWKACLDKHPESKAMIIKGIEAFSSPWFNHALMQVQSADQSEEMGVCKAGGAGDCVDPKSFDIEAFDCNCFDDLLGMSQQQLSEKACADAEVCCSWKSTHCAGSYSAGLVQINSSDGTAKASNLDETLTTKKTCR